MKKKLINDLKLDYLGSLYQELHQYDSMTGGIKSQTEKIGWVYFVSCGEYIKIGYTDKDDARKRTNGFKTANPFDLKLLKAVRATQRHEDWLHTLCRDHHHRLEWFHKSDFVMSIIEQAKDCTVDFALGLRDAIEIRKAEVKTELQKQKEQDDERKKQAPCIADEIFRLMLRILPHGVFQPVEFYTVAKLFGYSYQDHKKAGIQPLPHADKRYAFENVCALWLKQHLADRGLSCGPLIERFVTTAAYTISAEIDNHDGSAIPIEWFGLQPQMVATKPYVYTPPQESISVELTSQDPPHRKGVTH